VELQKAEFMKEEAQTISGIPSNPLMPKDKLIWICTVIGDFTV
jgi:hypothetical protein